jgi:hypothetical protein
MMKPSTAVCAMLAVALMIPRSGVAQTVRGRVLTDSGAVVVGATVILTAVPSAESRTTATDSSGRYLATLFDRSAAEYVLTISAAGRQIVRRRLAAVETTIDIVLTSTVAALPTVRVAATRPRPFRGVGLGAEGVMRIGTDPSDVTALGPLGTLPPELAGDLSAIASTVPGLAITPEGISAFGLGSASNVTTLNGLETSLGAVPRDMSKTVRYMSSPWDPSLGGGSGARIVVTASPGENVNSRRVRSTLDAPSLQFAGGDVRGLRQRYTSAAFNAAADGALALSRWFYNVAGTIEQRSAPGNSLLDLDATALARAGIASDTARRFLDALALHHVPTSGAVSSSALSRSGSIIARIDHRPPNRSESEPATHSWVSALLSATSSRTATGFSSVPTRGTTNNGISGIVQGAQSRYFGDARDILNETSTGVSLSSSRVGGGLDLPSASVFIGADAATRDRAAGSLSFGGSGGSGATTTDWTWEVVNTTTFNINGNSRRVAKLHVQSRLDGYARRPAREPLGAFTFSSLRDLELNRPSAFVRALETGASDGGQWSGGASLGTTWRQGDVYWVGGLRGDANVFLRQPSEDATLGQALGVSVSHAPWAMSLSPRLGFTWYYRGAPSYTVVFNNPIANYAFGNAAIRGGIGLFRDRLPAALLAPAIASGQTRTLTCLDEAAPAPDWLSYTSSVASVPMTCASAGAARVDTTRSATMFSPTFAAPKSWRASLGWSGRRFRSTISADATFSLNLNRAGVIDRNFAGQPQFTLSEEAGRPVYVVSSAIVPASGLSLVTGARRLPTFGRVLERVSDLRGDARQLAISVIPNWLPLRTTLVGYTYIDARTQSRGFDSPAAGNPFEREWMSVPVPRHAFIASVAQPIGPVAISAFVRVTSGVPFTPTVAGDVNGDGIVYDRAFVFDPSSGTDAARDAATRRLFVQSSRARRCLEPQLGRVAKLGSCRNGWTTTSNASVFLFPKRAGQPGRRTQASITISNLAAGADRLLHGSGQLRGWGAFTPADPILYRVRGFDPATRRFQYEVNERFGSATTPWLAPMRLSLDVMIDLGRPRAEQELEHSLRLQLPLVGTRAPVDSIKRRYLDHPRQGYVDLYGSLLQMADSLALAREQAEAFALRRPVLRATADSIFSDLAIALAALPRRYNPQDALRRVQQATDAMRAAVSAEGPFVLRTLTSGQADRVPRGLYELLKASTPSAKE